MPAKTHAHIRAHSGYCEICSTRYPPEAVVSEFDKHPEKPDHYDIHCKECQARTAALDAIQTEKLSAQRELARRELLRRRLINFVIRFIPGYNAGWVHKFICAKLERFVQEVEAKNSPRLMTFTPPRLGKSSIVSRALPAWALGHHPEWEYISASYAVGLPLGFSRWIKTTLQTREYRALFPNTHLDPNAQATDEWHTTKGGMYLPTGIGGGATGKGAHIFNIDDPVKDAQEARSETVLQSVWDWWDTVADTRISPGGGALLTMTRWSDLDLAGRISTQEREQVKELTQLMDDAQAILDDRTTTHVRHQSAMSRLLTLKADMEDVIHWDVITFPALATHDEYITTGGQLSDTPTDPTDQPVRRKNEALHPARYDDAYYRSKRKRTSKQFWSAMFQQNPTPDEGDKFKLSDIRYEPTPYPHEELPVYAAWDLAIGKNTSHDWTVALFGVMDYEGRLHIINRVRVRTDRLAQLIVDASIPYRHTLALTGIENGHIQLSIMPGLNDILDSPEIKKLDPPLHMVFDDKLKPVTDADVRSVPAQSMVQQGRVILPANQPWTEELVSELIRFPNGTFDDQVTALSWLVRMVSRKGPPRRQKEKPTKSWKDKLRIAQSTRKKYMAA